jgi:formyl-CoA transferase
MFDMIEQWTQQFTKYEVYEKCNEVDVPCGPIMDMHELLDDESLRARNMIVPVEHPKRGTFYTVGCPLNLSDSPVQVESSPLLGEHTEEILGELGYTNEDIERFRTGGAI